MPPNKEGRCDSCNEKSDVLIPLWVWDETSCGDMMVEKYYCSDCAEIRLNEGEDDEKEEKWIVAWFETEGDVGYQIRSSEEQAEEAYRELLKSEVLQEVVMGKVTKRRLFDTDEDKGGK